MSRYIDSDLAKSKIEERLLYRAKDVERLLDDIPTADVEPVRHGWWETIYNDRGHYGFEKCSTCGDEYGSLTYRYCPNCGAKMDEKEKEYDKRNAE